MQLNSTEKITVVVPVFETSQPSLLDLTFFSLSGQNDVEIDLIVQLTNGGMQAKEIQILIEKHPFSSQTKQTVVFQTIDEYGLSSWAKAWEIAKTKYFCIMEADSMLYLNALSLLLNDLKVSDSAFSLGGHRRSLYVLDRESSAVHVIKKQSLFNKQSLLNLFSQKSLALSSCLINRDKVAKSIFDKKIKSSISDEYQLLLKLAGGYSTSPALIGVDVSEIYVKDESQFDLIETLNPSLSEIQKVTVPLNELNQVLNENRELIRESKMLILRLLRKIKRLSRLVFLRTQY